MCIDIPHASAQLHTFREPLLGVTATSARSVAGIFLDATAGCDFVGAAAIHL